LQKNAVKVEMIFSRESPREVITICVLCRRGLSIIDASWRQLSTKWKECRGPPQKHRIASRSKMWSESISRRGINARREISPEKCTLREIFRLLRKRYTIACSNFWYYKRINVRSISTSHRNNTGFIVTALI